MDNTIPRNNVRSLRIRSSAPRNNTGAKKLWYRNTWAKRNSVLRIMQDKLVEFDDRVSELRMKIMQARARYEGYLREELIYIIPGFTVNIRGENIRISTVEKFKYYLDFLNEEYQKRLNERDAYLSNMKEIKNTPITPMNQRRTRKTRKSRS